MDKSNFLPGSTMSSPPLELASKPCPPSNSSYWHNPKEIVRMKIKYFNCNILLLKKNTNGYNKYIHGSIQCIIFINPTLTVTVIFITVIVINIDYHESSLTQFINLFMHQYKLLLQSYYYVLIVFLFIHIITEFN